MLGVSLPRGKQESEFSHSQLLPNAEVNLKQKIKVNVIHNLFYKIFDVVYADTPELKEEAHKMRYRVFCEEHDGYEDPEKHANGMEYDKYDGYSDHSLLIYKATGETIGTVRTIYSKLHDWEHSMPLQEICGSRYLHDELYIQNSVEFSRLCLSQELRKKVKQDVRSLTSNFNNRFTFYEKPLLNIALSMAPLALCRAGFEMAMRRDCLNIFGIMEPKYIKRLQASGLVFTPIGPEIEYHGTRQPFISNILETLDNSLHNNYEAWSAITNKGSIHHDAMELHMKQASAQN